MATSYVRYPVASGGGGATIGNPVTGGTANEVLYVDSSGNLANNPGFKYDGAGNATLGVAGTASSLAAPADALVNATKASQLTIQGANKTAGTGDAGDLRLKAGAVSNGAGYPGNVVFEAGGGDNPTKVGRFDYNGNFSVPDGGSFVGGGGSGVQCTSSGLYLLAPGGTGLFIYPGNIQPGLNYHLDSYGVNIFGGSAVTLHPWKEAHLTGGITLAYADADANPSVAPGVIQVKTGTNLVLSADKTLLSGGLGVGNSASATLPGTVVKKMEVFDAAGTSLGFIAIYDAIT